MQLGYFAFYVVLQFVTSSRPVVEQRLLSAMLSFGARETRLIIQFTQETQLGHSVVAHLEPM